MTKKCESRVESGWAIAAKPPPPPKRRDGARPVSTCPTHISNINAIFEYLNT
jgi:hypothetical protein